VLNSFIYFFRNGKSFNGLIDSVWVSSVGLTIYKIRIAKKTRPLLPRSILDGDQPAHHLLCQPISLYINFGLRSTMLRSDKSPAGICQSHPRTNLLS
jgi:hypothetical protein